MPLVAIVLLLIAASRGQGDHTVATDSLWSHALVRAPDENRSLRDRWGITESHAWGERSLCLLQETAIAKRSHSR